MKKASKKENRYRRHRRVRAKIKGTSKVPRLCIFKSSKHIYAQLIDDEKGKTILSSDDIKLKKTKTKISSSAGDELRSSSPFAKARVVDELRSSSPFAKARVVDELRSSSPTEPRRGEGKDEDEVLIARANARVGKIGLARQVGKMIAEKACREGIKRVVFDRGGYKYHGRVKALAEVAREGGLIF